MKKVLAILPLMTAIFLAPSCKVTIGWDKTEFTYENPVIEENKASVTINWSSGAHLKFKKIEFVPDNEAIKVAEIMYDETSTMWPKTVDITFEEAPTEDSVEGLLNYTYTNNDTGANGDNQQKLTFVKAN